MHNRCILAANLPIAQMAICLLMNFNHRFL
jgi:hypothetical protein